MENEKTEIKEKELDREEKEKELEENNSKKEEKKKDKKKIYDIIILILIVIIIILLLRSCHRVEQGVTNPPQIEIETGEYVEPSEETSNKVSGYTDIPVITDFTVSKSDPYKTLYNPETNKGKSYLTYTFTNEETGEIIYESKLVQAGDEYKFSVPFGELLEVGSYRVEVKVGNLDYNNPDITKNGTVSNITITVVE